MAMPLAPPFAMAIVIGDEYEHLNHPNSIRLFVFQSPPRRGMNLVTNRQGAIYLASTNAPGPDWKPGTLIFISCPSSCNSVPLSYSA